MTTEEFKKNVQEALNKVNDIFNLSSPFFVDNSNNTNLRSIFHTLDYLNHIMEDVEYSVIPETFYDFIIENIKEFKIGSLDLSELLKKGEIQLFDIEKKLSQTSLDRAIWDRHIYLFFKSLGFARVSTVVVGANGSGKTSLATMLKQQLPSKNGIVIPSQKILIIPTLSSIPNDKDIISEYNSYQQDTYDYKVTYKTTKSDDFPYSEVKKFSAEFNVILRSLIAERINVNNTYCDKIKNKEQADPEDLFCTLDRIIKIWNSLIEHRELSCDNENNLIVKTKGSDAVYPAYQMSDGEKVILYLTSRVIKAPLNGYIIVDEPELYLHRAIVDKLWNQLELERQDCIFIYMTHDLDFASSRNAKKFWIQNFKYNHSWSIEPIPENNIPESLLMELLGSRKKILFCEGENNERSLDLSIYELLFPDYTIRAVRSCKDVISYTRAFNKIANKNAKAYGLIDRDFRTEEQFKKLREDNIYCLQVAEVENLFLTEGFISAFVDYKAETITIQKLKQKTIEKLTHDKERQVANFLSNKINFYFKESHLKGGNSKDEIYSSFNDFRDQIMIEEWYSERSKEIDDLIKQQDYEKVVELYNNKGLHTIIENLLGYKSNEFRNKAIDFLRKNEKARLVLQRKFPQELLTD
ncbi:AAA family ATPase [Massilibacteroides sp.]|uniref:DUF4435 domain-containing protein n=1 Tax=Massilibacteroides sp. TaxID=2034766 RepID=UPI002621D2D8|nr:AAA family ATPase [Massilibacteroides sp.]MDD4514826.1 AAA family ATPase [Massilibacteroides sp.]